MPLLGKGTRVAEGRLLSRPSRLEKLSASGTLAPRCVLASTRGAYTETQARREFIDTLFEALGRDIAKR